MIAALYTLWQLAGTLSVLGTEGAFARAELDRAGRARGAPAGARPTSSTRSPATSLVAQAANLYYATMHFGVLFVFLLWLFVRHRDEYRQVRRVLALTTFVCLVIQLLPVAPPRLLPGYVDTAREYGQSVYGPAFGGFGADQLSAMPSVHVAWAVLIGVGVLRLGRGPWRWIGAGPRGRSPSSSSSPPPTTSGPTASSRSRSWPRAPRSSGHPRGRTCGSGPGARASVTDPRQTLSPWRDDAHPAP